MKKMKKLISLFLVLAMLAQAICVLAEDSAWEDDMNNNDTNDQEMIDNNNNTDNLDDDDAIIDDSDSTSTNQSNTSGLYVSDYDYLFEQELVKEDYSDQMNEEYAKYGMFLSGTIQDMGKNQYNSGSVGGGQLSEEDMRADINANLPEINVNRILSGNIAFVADCTSYWHINQKKYMDKPAIMDEEGNFNIPADIAYYLFKVSYNGDYVPAEYIEKVTDYDVFTDIRGFLMFSQNLGASVDTSLTGSGENMYYADFYWISDCIGTIAWEDLHPTAEQYADFRQKWAYSITYPEGTSDEYSDYIADSIASAKEYMSHINRGSTDVADNINNSPFDHIYIPDLYESGEDINSATEGDKFKSHSNQQYIENAVKGILNMARGYNIAKREGLESEEWLKECRDSIIYATMFMTEKHLCNNAYKLEGTPRFTSFRITAFYSMMNAFILMGDDLPEQVKYDCIMEFYGRSRYVSSNYTNRFWLSMPMILSAMVLEDDVRLNHAFRYMNQCFAEVKKGEDYPMDTEGFFEDGSYPYHGGLAYNLGYGQSFVISVAELVSVSDGTIFDISNIYSFENMYKWIKIAWLPFIYKNTKMKMVVGREAPYASARHPVAAMMLIADKAPAEIRKELIGYIKPAIEGVQDQFYTHNYFAVFRSLSYPYIIENIDGIINDSLNAEGVETTEYNKVYYNMDRIVHMRDGWMFGLAMSSARTGKYESSTSSSTNSLTEWYISDGMTYLHNDEVQYMSPWWKGDPYFLSGTTVDDSWRDPYTQTMSMSASQWGKPENLWAGGATTGTIGAAAYENGNQFVTGLDALKSYFMFEDYVVCIGTGITAGTGVIGATGDAYTVVERRQLVEEPETPATNGTPAQGYEDVVVDGTTLDVEFGTKEQFENPGYIWIEDRTGYVFSGKNTISVKREEMNSYSFLKVVAEHGKKAKDESYAYTILPIATAEETAAWAENPDIEIIEQSNTMHAVRQKSTGVVMANLFKATELEGIKFETPCTVIIVPESDGKTFYVADPRQKLDEISMIFPEKVTVTGDTAVANGKSVTVTVRKRPGDTYSFKVVNGTSEEDTTSALKTYSYNIKITGNTAATTLSAYGKGKVTFEIAKNGGYGTAVFVGDQLYYTTQESGSFTDVIQIRATDEAGNSGVFSVQVRRSGN